MPPSADKQRIREQLFHRTPLQRELSRETSKPVVKRTKAKREARTVRFSLEVDVRTYRYLHVNDYTDEEYFSSWYRAEEYATIKRDITATIGTVQSGKDLNNNLFTLRGLETRTKAGSLKRKMARLTGMIAVLDEQARQQKLEITNSKYLNMVYNQVSVRCLREAQQRAKDDEVAIQASPKEVAGCEQIRHAIPSSSSKKEKRKALPERHKGKLFTFFGKRQ